MSFEIVTIVLGIVFILIAIVGSIQKKDSSANLISTTLRIPVGLIGILLIIYGGYSFGAVNLQGQIEQADVATKLEVSFPIESVQIISPVEGDLVKCRTLAMGVYPDSHEKDIWVLLKPSDNKYYPQSDHTNTSYKRNGEWQVITRFGGDKDEEYEVIVYETDASASEFFSTTIEDWKEVESYPGLELDELPDGAIEVDRISVSLLDNCRGVF